MKKKLCSLLLAVLLLTVLIIPAAAADLPRFVDMAGILNEDEAAQLTATLDSLSAELQTDFVVFVVDTLGGEDPDEACSWILDNYHYGYGENRECVILMLNMGERDWDITANGYAEEAIPYNTKLELADRFLDDLSAGNYYDGFDTFAYEAAALIRQAQSTGYKTPFPLVRNLGICLAISLLAAVVTVSVMKGKLKTVEKQRTAANYVVPGTMNLTVSRDRFLFRNVTRTPRPKDTGSRSGGGGGSRGSAHGKF